MKRFTQLIQFLLFTFLFIGLYSCSINRQLYLYFKHIPSKILVNSKAELIIAVSNSNKSYSPSGITVTIINVTSGGGSFDREKNLQRINKKTIKGLVKFTFYAGSKPRVILIEAKAENTNADSVYLAIAE